MKRTILLKLGGSLITDKEKPLKVKKNIIRNLAGEIKEAIGRNKNISLVIAHGQGSYGHYEAMKHDLSKGIQKESQKTGFCQIHQTASALNQIIVRELLEAGINAFSLSPSSMIVSRGGETRDFFIDPLVKLLDSNITPVLYGDIAYDEISGAKIYSSERLLREIALKLLERKIPVTKIIHAGITPGVTDDKGNIIPRINKNNIGRVAKYFRPVKGYDVTGGIAHKVDESLKLASFGVESLIINGSSRGKLLKKALLNEPVAGTVVRA
jgi:isopentenyl phosphate kinase